MTGEKRTASSQRIKVALVGGNEEGLLTLASLVRDPDIEVLMLIDRDEKALAFRLHEYGFTFDKIFSFTVGSEISDLKRSPEIDLIIDATGDPKIHQELYLLNHPAARIMTSRGARILCEIKSTEDKMARSGLKIEDREEKATRPDILIQKGGLALLEMMGAVPHEEVSRFSVEALLHGLEADWAALSLTGKKGEGLSTVSAVSYPADSGNGEGTTGKEGLSLLASNWTRKEGGLLLIPPSPADPWAASFLETAGLAQYIAVPLLDQSGLVGLLEIGKKTGRPAWGRAEAAVAETWVSQEAFKKHVFLSREQKDAFEPLLKKLKTLMESTRPLEEQLDNGVAEVAAFLNASSSLLFVREPETGDLVLKAQVGYPVKLKGLYRLKQEEGLVGEAFRVGRPVVLKEISPPRKKTPLGMIFFPLAVHSTPVGLLVLEFKRFQSRHLDWKENLKEVADIFALSIFNDVERKYMSQKVMKLAVVNEEGLELISFTSRDKVLMTAAVSSAMILEAEGVILRVKEKENSRLLVGYTYGLQNTEMDKFLIQLDGILSENVKETRQPAVYADLKKHPVLKGKIPSKFPYRSVLSIPLLYEETVIGTISAYNKVLPQTFSTTAFNEIDLEVIEKYGQFVSRALVKAREHHQREQLITIDELTGLKNERYLNMRLPEELKRAERFKRKVSLLFLDLDLNYREYEKLPQLIFDDLIVKIGHVIRETFRHVDISVRVRGTRFAVLLPDTGSGFGETLHRLNASLSELEIYNAGRQRLPVKLMTGFGVYPDHAVTVEELIQKASKVWPYDEGKK